MNLQSLVQALDARICGSSCMASCPAHDDHDPSLSIREVDGKILLHCHAGCSQWDVIVSVACTRSVADQNKGTAVNCRHVRLYGRAGKSALSGGTVRSEGFLATQTRWPRRMGLEEEPESGALQTRRSSGVTYSFCRRRRTRCRNSSRLRLRRNNERWWS